MEFIVLWVVLALLPAVAAHARGRSGLGFFVYGLLLWPVALVHVLALPRLTPKDRAERDAAIRRESEFNNPFRR